MNEINFHTHYWRTDNSIQITNYLAHNLPFVEDGHLYSAGIHPWHIEMVDIESCLLSMEDAMTKPKMIAIGECGLDRAISTGFALQEQIFRNQIEMAIKYSKPLIIHCVRAYSELIRIKKHYPSSLPWIIHGFDGNKQTTTELIKHDLYFSVGEGLLNKPLHVEALSLIPPNHLFFETDDRDIPISDIYSLAARVLNIETDTLRELIFDNFIHLFGENTAVVDRIKSLNNHI